MFKIFIGNLDKRTTVEQVKMLLASFPDLEDLVLATDDDGKSRGFAIAMFRDPERGKEAIAALSQRRINGRELVVNEALSKKDRKKFLAEKAKQDAERQRGFGPRGPGGMSSRPSNRPFNRNPRRGGGFDDRRGYGDSGSSGPSFGSPRQFGGHGGGRGGFGGPPPGPPSGPPSGPPGTGRIGGVGLGGARPMGGAGPGAPRPLTFGPGRPTTPPSAIPLAAPRSPLAPRGVPPVPARPASPAGACPSAQAGVSSTASPSAPADASPVLAQSAPPVAESARIAASEALAAVDPPAATAAKTVKAASTKSAEKPAAKPSPKAAGRPASKAAPKSASKASGDEPKPKAKASKPGAARRKKSSDEE